MDTVDTMPMDVQAVDSYLAQEIFCLSGRFPTYKI